MIPEMDIYELMSLRSDVTEWIQIEKKLAYEALREPIQKAIHERIKQREQEMKEEDTSEIKTNTDNIIALTV